MADEWDKYAVEDFEKYAVSEPSVSAPTATATRDKSIDEKIANRGGFISPVTNPVQAFNEFKRKMSTGGAIGKTGAALEALGMPITQVVSSISAPVTTGIRQAMPGGQFDPKQIFNEFIAGTTGAKQYQAGDPFRAAGFPETASATAGLALEMAVPLNIIKAGYGALPAIVRRGSDKGINLAGQKIVQGVDQARDIIGSRLEKVYEYVNDFKLTNTNVSKLLNAAADLPEVVVKEAKKILGKEISDISSIKELRVLKQILGKAKSSAFGKRDLGVAEGIEAGHINDAYRGISEVMHDSIKSGAGEKFAKKLKDADTAFSETSKAGDLLKSTIMSKKLMKPTKAGRVAEGMIQEGNTEIRDALNIIKSSGSGAKKNIDIAIKSLDWFNKKQAMARMAEHAVGAAIFGGMMGAVGGKALQSVAGKD